MLYADGWLLSRWPIVICRWMVAKQVADCYMHVVALYISIP